VVYWLFAFIYFLLLVGSHSVRDLLVLILLLLSLLVDSHSLRGLLALHLLLLSLLVGSHFLPSFAFSPGRLTLC
jgi:hypothetical protein